MARGLEPIDVIAIRSNAHPQDADMAKITHRVTNHVAAGHCDLTEEAGWEVDGNARA